MPEGLSLWLGTCMWPLLQAVSWKQQNQTSYLSSSWAFSPACGRQMVTSSKGLSTCIRSGQATLPAHECSWGCLPSVGTVIATACPTTRHHGHVHLTPHELLMPGGWGPQWLLYGGMERLSIVLGIRVQGNKWLRTQGQGGREAVGGRKIFQLSL